MKKNISHHFKGLSTARNCLKPKSEPLKYFDLVDFCLIVLSFKKKEIHFFYLYLVSVSFMLQYFTTFFNAKPFWKFYERYKSNK